MLDAYFEAHDLPRHPLEAEGYPSIGCSPCTSKVKPGEDPRAGRWRGWDKTECGIHEAVTPLGAAPANDPAFCSTKMSSQRKLGPLASSLPLAAPAFAVAPFSIHTRHKLGPATGRGRV